MVTFWRGNTIFNLLSLLKLSSRISCILAGQYIPSNFDRNEHHYFVFKSWWERVEIWTKNSTQRKCFTWTSWKNSLSIRGFYYKPKSSMKNSGRDHRKKNFIFHSTCFKLINTDCKTSKIAFMKGKVSPETVKKSWTLCFC